jgi:hypothetical protein
MGKIALQHIALAESYALLGGTQAALDQLQLARKSTDASFYEQAVIDARERDWQAKRREAMGDKKKDYSGASFSVKAGTAESTDPFGRKSERDCDTSKSVTADPFRRVDPLTRSDPLLRRDPLDASCR